MSDPNLNWDEVLGDVEKYEADPETKKSDDFEALAPGPYNVVVQEAEKLVASTGSDMIKVRVQVIEGPYANRVLFNYIVFKQGSPQAMRMTLERLAAFGITREFIATRKPSIPEIAELLVGRKAVAVVAIQQSGEYKGSNEIKRFKPLDGAEQPALEVAKAKPAGVPDIPQPQVAEAQATAATAPVIPLPEVPVGAGDAADPFEG